jgi:hypothetical protein
MCLDTTKQGYVLLGALERAGDKSLDWTQLLERMAEVSKSKFGSEDYVFLPSPLRRIIDKSKIAGEIALKDGGWILTDRGRSNLEFITRKFVGADVS